MTYESVKQQLEELLAVEHPLAEAWTRHEYADTDLARFLERVPEAGAAVVPRELLYHVVQITASLPEPERSRLVVWFIARMAGVAGGIEPDEIESVKGDGGEFLREIVRYLRGGREEEST